MARCCACPWRYESRPVGERFNPPTRALYLRGVAGGFVRTGGWNLGPWGLRSRGEAWVLVVGGLLISEGVFSFIHEGGAFAEAEHGEIDSLHGGYGDK